MPETKTCPKCGRFCDLVRYVTASQGGPVNDGTLDVWECPDRGGCGWEADAE